MEAAGETGDEAPVVAALEVGGHVRCSDGQQYDLEFDTAFKLTKKKLDD